jgi:hypothetical protein
MRNALVDILAPWLATLAFWFSFGACVEQPPPDPPPIARIVATWDPLACGPPHRVVLELEDAAGVQVAASSPCSAGGIAIDTRHRGAYTGRIFATELDPRPVEVDVESEVYTWWLGAPP